MGLFGYAGKAAGLPLNPDLGLGMLVPIVAAGVWLAQRRVHHRIGRRGHQPGWPIAFP